MKQLAGVFVDSDVIISSLISQKGAAYLLLSSKNIKKVVSNLSQKELEIVVDRLNLDKNQLKKTVKNNLEMVLITKNKKFEKYVFDKKDAHVIAGAIKAKSKFLLTYNIKHYKLEAIKKDFDIIILRPAEFLQFLRSN